MIHEPPWPTEEEKQEQQNRQENQKQLAFQPSSLETPAWMATLTKEQGLAQRAEAVEATCFLADRPPANRQPQTVKKLQERIAELERTIEIMHASRIYQECHPDSTLADLQAENIRQREQIAEIIAQAERAIAEQSEQRRIAAQIVLDQEEEIKRLGEQDTRQRAMIARLQEREERHRHTITRLWQSRRLLRQIERRYGCNAAELATGSPKTVPLAAHQKVQQELEIVNRLERNPKLKPALASFIRHTINTTRFGTIHDQDGRTRLNLNNIAERMGMSSSTAQRMIKTCQEQLTDLFDIATYEEQAPDGKNTTRYYAAVKPETLSRLATIEPREFRKQGGDRYTCPRCGASHIHRETYKKVLLVCDDCGHKSILEDTQISIDYPNDSYTKQDAAKHDALKCKLQANIITIDPPQSDSLNATAEAQDITAAAELLLAIAGDAEVHIEMSRTGEKKYYTVPRRLQFSDLVDHLRGGRAKGALCSYRDGSTRALIFDTDAPAEWDAWKVAARKLVEAGYLVLLDESPAGRGGHLLIIFDAPVLAAAARAAVLAIFPELADCPEYWPPPASARNWNRVRLPGAFYARYGKYVERPVKAWCKLTSMATGEIAGDGISAARLLLANMTPAAIVPPIQGEQIAETPVSTSQQPKPERQPQGLEMGQQAALAGALSNEAAHQGQQDAQAAPTIRLPKVDAEWTRRYGEVERTTLWFAVTEEYAAAWFNEHHPLESIRPRERNGMALSPNGDERTASTSYHQTAQGERYTDHSQHGKRPDGTKDSGDALELACKIWGESKAVLLKRAAGEIVARARAAMTAAARAGELPPAWVCELMTPAGWRKYDELAARKKMERQPAGSAEPERTETRSVVAPVPAKPLDKADEIKAWAKTHDWPAFEVNGRLLIAAGQSNWLHILLMAGYRDVRDRVYAEIQRRASEAAAPVEVVAPDQGH